MGTLADSRRAEGGSASSGLGLGSGDWSGLELGSARPTQPDTEIPAAVRTVLPSNTDRFRREKGEGPSTSDVLLRLVTL